MNPTETLRKRPNLFIIGAMKSGTTSLHNYLNTHPDIFMSPEKEPGYFAKDINWARGSDWYLGLFSAATNERYIGESSTSYTKFPKHKGVPDRIRAFVPNPRLIYLMRHPFERLVSHYWYSVRGIDANMETDPINKAIYNNPEYLAFGDYAMQLRPYIDLFGVESIYTLTLEALACDPDTEVNKIFRWLDLPKLDTFPDGTKIFNERPHAITVAAYGGLLNQLRYSEAWGTIADIFPNKIRKLARRVAYTTVSASQQKAEIEQLRSQLTPPLEAKISELEQLLGKRFPEWKADPKKLGEGVQQCDYITDVSKKP